MLEEWKDIPGYEGLYQVSNLGRVKSLSKVVNCYNGFRTLQEKILKQNIQKGYATVLLYHCNKKRYVTHRLVAEAFIPNPENKPFIDHINTIRTDNRVENLRWVTAKENINNPITRASLFGRKHSEYTKEKISNSAFKKTILCVETGTIYQSLNEAAKQTKICKTCLSAVCNGKRNTAGGYHWQYVEN